MEVIELATFLPNTLYTSRDNPLGFKISVPLNKTPLSEITLFTADTAFKYQRGSPALLAPAKVPALIL